MKVLAIDGALGAFSAAIADGPVLLGERSETGNVALESGLALVAGVLSSTGSAPRSLARLAVGIGPGGFTGLRIAVAYAKSLAQAWELPLVPVSSFDLLEYGLTLRSTLTVVVGRPGVISARYRGPEGDRRASGFIADVLDAIAPPADGEMLDVVGAPEDVVAMLAERGIIVNALSPAIAPAAAAALAAQDRAAAHTPHEVRADYGELPAAKVPKQ
jgi:tRNA threonylcarbamoyladenosine biosynthesis protein TsaB